MELVSVINTVLGAVFFICYFYQFVYIAALFRRVEWKPIRHTQVKTVEEIKR